MNWSDVGSAILKYAPVAGAALTSPVGAVVGLGTMIANLFGSDATPEGVMEFIKSNPDRAAERLQFEMANNLEMQTLALNILQEKNRAKERNLEIENEKLKAINADTSDARANSVNIATNPVYNLIMVLLVLGAFTVVAYCLHLISSADVSQTESPLISMIIGAFSTCLIGAFGFFFGSSLGSQLKDNVMRFAGK
jgi:hypothetical protein